MLSSTDNMQQRKFCGATFNALIVSSERSSIVVLRELTVSRTEALQKAYFEVLNLAPPLMGNEFEAVDLLEQCYNFLENLSLGWPSM